MAKKITLKNVRLSWPKIWTAEQYQGKGEFNYEATFIIPPDSEAAKLLQATYLEVATEQWADKAPEKLASFKGNLLKTFFYNGNLKPETEGYPGNLIAKAKKKQKDGRPDIRDRGGVIGADGKFIASALTEADGRPYGGCIVNGIVEVWAQDAPNDGMRCKLLGMQFVKDGDRFSGGTPASDEDYENLSDGADAPDVGAPQAAAGGNYV